MMMLRESIRLACALVFTLMLAPVTSAAPLPVCEGGDRAARMLTCIVDGDTGWENGVKWRYDSIDTPEMPGHAECDAEAQMAVQSRDRLRELMGDSYTINWSGDEGSYGRALVTIELADGRYAGEVLISEQLAQPWPNQGNVWCGR
ncbi:thermonuclease family protein [Pararhizobium haloflavum]|uniref:thermonuclease family protein n=1 Tax=Pararhizobium haloflavum TaxID=2037914 RepID=UPI000C1A45AB|nr:nuclease [Pararhizobium haloflavum]